MFLPMHEYTHKHQHFHMKSLNSRWKHIFSYEIKGNYSKQTSIHIFSHEIKYNDSFTNISTVFDNLDNDAILITDGVNNYGNNNYNLLNNYKLNILGIGDENILKTDIGINLINVVNAKDTFILIVEIQNYLHSNYKNQNLYLSNSKVIKQSIDEFNLNSDTYQIKKEIE